MKHAAFMKHTTTRATRIALAIAGFAIGIVTARAGEMTLPAGAQLHVVLETTLNTKKTQVGDPFRARLVQSVFADEHEVLTVSTLVTGTVVSVTPPGRATGRAEMQLRPEMLYLPDGRDISLTASIHGSTADSDSKIDPTEGSVKAGNKDPIPAKQTAQGAAMGAGIGAAVGGLSGAAIGAGAVGAIAVLHHIMKKGKDAELPAGTELVLEVTRAVEISDMQAVPPKPKGPAPVR